MPGGLGMPVKLNSSLPYFWRIAQFCRQNTHFVGNSSCEEIKKELVLKSGKFCRIYFVPPQLQ